jgi:hypothetical protein
MSVGAMKLNEHPACSCGMCRIGKATSWGQSERRRINRVIRQLTRVALRKQGEDFVRVIVGTPYLD